MLFQLMLDQLVFTVIFHAAAVTSIGFVIRVSTNVVVSVADSCEALVAVDTTVRFLSSVNSHVDNQVSTFIEALGTERTMEGGRYVRCSAESIEIFFLAVLFL